MSWQLPRAFEAGLARWRAAAPAWLEDVLPGRPQLLALGIVAAVGGTIGLVAWAAQPTPASRVAPGTAAKAGDASAQSVALEQPTLALPADLRAGSAAAQATPAAGGTAAIAEPAVVAPILAVLPAGNTARAEQAANAPAAPSAAGEGGTAAAPGAAAATDVLAATLQAEAQATTPAGAETQQVVGDLPTADVEPTIVLAEAAPEVAVPADEVDEVAVIGPAATVEEATLPVTPERVETPPAAAEVAVAPEVPAVTALDGTGPVRDDVAEADSAPLVGQTAPEEQRRDPDLAWAQLQPELESALASDAGRAIVLIDSFLAGAPDHPAARDRRTQALVALTPTPTPPPPSPTPTSTPPAPTATPTRPPTTPTARPQVVVPAQPPPPPPKPAPAPPPAAPDPAPTATKVPFRP